MQYNVELIVCQKPAKLKTCHKAKDQKLVLPSYKHSLHSSDSMHQSNIPYEC